MKFTKLLCLLLALSFIFCAFASCKKGDNTPSGQTGGAVSTDTEIVPKRDYGVDFMIKDIGEMYYWAEGYDNGSSIDSANYEREVAIEEHLGIQILHESYKNIADIHGDISMMAMSGVDGCQLVVTHCYEGTIGTVKEGLYLDLSEVPGISFNDDYYNNDIMESVTYQGRKYLGSSSFIIHRPNYVVFNKNMANDVSNLIASFRAKNPVETIGKTDEQVADLMLKNGGLTAGELSMLSEAFGKKASIYRPG